MNTNAKIDKLQKELELIAKAAEKYWDLRSDKDSRGAIRWVSTLANADMNNVEIQPSCLCCVDASVYAWPYLSYKGQRIYSDPMRYYIGDKIPCAIGISSAFQWQNDLRDAKIKESVIAKIESYLKKNPVEYLEDEEEYDFEFEIEYEED